MTILGHYIGPAPRGHEIGIDKRPELRSNVIADEKPEPLKPTPGPWFVLKTGDIEFIAAKPTEDHPYFGKTRFIDIAGDEDYPRKKADMELIVSLRNQVSK